MTYGFYIFISLFLVIIRTTVFPLFSSLSNCFDFLLPIVVYLGFFRSLREGIFGIVVFGLLMDGMSGVSFGFHLSTYVWLYVIVHTLKQFLQVKNIFMLSFMTAVGVVIENGILIIAENLFNPKLNVLKAVVKLSMVQIVLAVIIGPVFIVLIKQLHEAWVLNFQKIFSRSKEE